MANRKNPYINALSTMRHDFVEIGGIKWATCNVGADKPWEAGLYFQWGDTNGYSKDDINQNHKIFDLRSYKFLQGACISKYNTYDMKSSVDIEDDAVNVMWEGNWRTPQVSDYQCLCNSTTCCWVNNYKQSGVPGYIFTDNTDNTKHLFFPAHGYGYDKNVNYDKYIGFYWFGTLDSSNLDFAYHLLISHNTNEIVRMRRFYGCNIRGILS